MLDRDTRAAILRLRREGHGQRTIAKALGVARETVRRVLASGETEVPAVERGALLDEHTELVRRLWGTCKGNAVRVHEELVAAGVEVSYSSVTVCCRELGLAEPRRERVGHYDFGPGEEMQHDTSPHRVEVGGRQQMVECASLVLCWSRMRFAQAWSHWNRFACRCFLTTACEYFDGAAGRCVIDNTSVIRQRGTGATMEPAPEMLALAARFGFAFVAHAVGDANRSAHVERGFDYLEKNFYPGRVFADLADLNAQLLQWCRADALRFRRPLGASPVELFQTEYPLLRRLPLHIPEVYEDHLRRVDAEGFVQLYTNRYSVPDSALGSELRLRQKPDRLEVLQGHRLLCAHPVLPHGSWGRSTLPEHRHKGRRRPVRLPPLPEESALAAADPALAELITKLRQRHGGQAARAVKRLHRMWLDYPVEALLGATREALHFGLLDLKRLERMTLCRVAGDFFSLPHSTPADQADEPQPPADPEEKP
jgi:transposase